MPLCFSQIDCSPNSHREFRSISLSILVLQSRWSLPPLRIQRLSHLRTRPQFASVARFGPTSNQFKCQIRREFQRLQHHSLLKNVQFRFYCSQNYGYLGSSFSFKPMLHQLPVQDLFLSFYFYLILCAILLSTPLPCL